MKKDEEGRKKVTQWTRYLTVALALVQAYGFALFTGRCRARCRVRAPWFTIQMMLFLTTGALFVMWLGEQITERGLGNGASLLIFFSIVERLLARDLPDVPASSARGRDRSSAVAGRALMVAIVAAVVAMTVAARRIAHSDPAAHDGPWSSA
jgi:preprotein translocase subunit SecY